ncbi:MAG: hypothetical protein J6Z31_02595 [Fibrobacter sp.]|nr:hypothetical protein [Fibrobacter sp.]
MKKALRIIGIVVAVLIFLGIAACFIAPKIAKGYVEDHAKELLGRRMQIGDISFNPFRFTFPLKTSPFLNRTIPHGLSHSNSSM